MALAAHRFSGITALLGDADRRLLERDFSIDDPSQIAGLADRIWMHSSLDDLEELAKWAAMDGSLRFTFEVDGRALRDRLSGKRLDLVHGWEPSKFPAMKSLAAALHGVL